MPDVESALYSDIEKVDALADDEPLACIDIRDLDLLSLPSPDFVVDYLMPEAGVVLFSGDSGSCKTALMLHIGLAIAIGKPVGGRFATKPSAGPMLYFNGELDPSQTQLASRQAAAGFAIAIADAPQGSFHFVGEQGMVDFRFGIDDAGRQLRSRVEATIRTKKPSIVVIDTMRALFDIDEKEATQIRTGFAWLKQISAKHRCCIVVAHHLRKAGERNGQRERVSGSSDLIAVSDVHLHAISHSPNAMHALYVDKTRFAKDGVRAGTQFSVQGDFETPLSSGAIGRSAFTIGAPAIADAAIESETSHERDLIEMFTEKRAMTRNDAGAGEKGSGSMKRAWATLAKRRRIVKTDQMRGKGFLWELAGERDELFAHSDNVAPGQVPGHAFDQPVSERPETSVVQGLNPGQQTGPGIGPDTKRDRPDDRDVPAPARAGAPVSHQAGKPSGPTGPTYIEWPGKSGQVGEADASPVETEVEV